MKSAPLPLSLPFPQPFPTLFHLIFHFFAFTRVAVSRHFLSILFQDCSFNKLQSDTALKVSFQGNTKVQSDVKCNRWFFKFNGNECSGPMTIEAVVYSDWSSGTPNLLHHRSFEGYCTNIPQGAVTVELWVGQCTSYPLGDAYTGWNSVSRIIIEEVSRPQS